jgi:hypothetical protein
MAPESGDEIIWAVRAAIYYYIARHERPPTVDETAAQLGMNRERVGAAYERLHERHAIYLDPGSQAVRMANPFSGVPTGFRVRANEHAYWANCAWDALGIPAALGTDAVIEAVCSDTQTPTTLKVEGGVVIGQGEVIHFPLPFSRWYDDLIRT